MKRLDKIIDTIMLRFGDGIALLVVILVTVIAYISVFLMPLEAVQGIPPEFARAIWAIAAWIIAQGIWQGISQFTKITFGSAFQAGIFAIVAGIVSTHQQTGHVHINPQTAALFVVILIGMALLDNFPRWLMQSDDKDEAQKEKPKRNIGLFEKSPKNQLTEADQPEQDDYLHKLDYLTGRGQ